ncbi:hypothetical protein V9T40_006018 [Parthenolecanium corni]|uniref:Uncharacterized protein n=1 Tax=Parthenolecanium corni TaxID=536013 RepID=A0AAN9YB82_9HEMI
MGASSEQSRLTNRRFRIKTTVSVSQTATHSDSELIREQNVEQNTADICSPELFNQEDENLRNKNTENDHVVDKRKSEDGKPALRRTVIMDVQIPGPSGVNLRQKNIVYEFDVSLLDYSELSTEDYMIVTTTCDKNDNGIENSNIGDGIVIENDITIENDIVIENDSGTTNNPVICDDNEPISLETTETTQIRRRKACPDEWKQNKQAAAVISGKRHITKSGNEIPAK